MAEAGKPLLTLPCKMRMQDFSPDGDNFHCKSCEKVITDFRGRTNDEVFQHIREASHKVCGVFRNDQIEYKRSTVIIPAGVQRFGLSLLGILGFLGPVMTGCADDAPQTPANDKIQQAFNKLKFPMKIEGILKDEGTGEVMPFSKVSILQNGKVIRTDQTNKDGFFSITIQKGDLIKENFEFAISKNEFADTLENYSIFRRTPGEKVVLTVSASCDVKGLSGVVMPEKGEVTETEVVFTEFISGDIAMPPPPPPEPPMFGEPMMPDPPKD